MLPKTFFIYIIYLLILPRVYSETSTPLSNELLSKIEDGLIHSKSTVKNLDNDKQQSFDFIIAGLHKKNCDFALRKLSLYEEFENFMGMIEKSKYDEKKGRIYLLLSHTLLPFRMSLSFNIPRITDVGIYPFSFDKGFLKGLTGNIYVNKHNNRCLFTTTASWRGKHTGFSPTFFEFFSSAAAKHSMEVLFRISSNY